MKSPVWNDLENSGFIGLSELRRQAVEGKKPFDYDRPIEGLRALDRYTLQFRLERPSPRFLTKVLSGSDLYGAVAREVVQMYRDNIMATRWAPGPSSWCSGGAAR